MARVWNGIQTILGLILMALIAVAIVAYLFNGDSSGADGCPGDSVPDPRPPHECGPRSYAIESQATMDAEVRRDEQERQGEIFDATWQAEREAERDAEYRREAEAAHEDAIRSCILAGNQPNLCELDPGDPYGVDDRD